MPCENVLVSWLAEALAISSFRISIERPIQRLHSSLMVQRVHLRRRHSYNTVSNKVRKVKTPGGKLTVHYVTKIAKAPSCKDTKKRLSGLPRVRPGEFSRLTKRQRTVSRAYGGVLSHKSVRDRIVRAFLTEEVKVIKRRVAASKKAAK